MEREKAKRETQGTMDDFVKQMHEGKLTANAIIKSELPPVDEGSKEHFLRALEIKNKRGLEEESKTDRATFNDLFRRVHLEYGDENKITDVTALNKSVLAGKLEYNDFVRLRNEFYADRDPAGQSFAKAKAQLVRTAENRVGRTSLGTVDPAGAKAVYEFQKRLDATVDEYRAGNKDPWELLDPKSPKFALNWVQQRSPIDVIREQAESFRKGAEGKISTIKDDADYAKLPPGAKFVDPHGKIRQKPGEAPKRDGDSPTSPGSEKRTAGGVIKR